MKVLMLVQIKQCRILMKKITSLVAVLNTIKKNKIKLNSNRSREKSRYANRLTN